LDFTVWLNITALFYSGILLLSIVLFAMSRKGVKVRSSNANLDITVRPTLVVLAFTILWAVMAFRHEVAKDYYSYIRIYDEIASRGFIWALETLRTEPGYALFNILIKYIFNDHQYVFIISSFIVLFFVFITIIDNKESINFGYALFAYIVSYYFWMWTAVRISIAIVIVFYAYRYIIEKNIFKYSVFVLIAFLFHYTAIIIWPLYFLISSSNKTKKHIYNTLFYILLISIFISFNIIFELLFSDTKYEVYQVMIGNLRSGLNQFILKLPLFFLFTAYRKTLISINQNNVVYLRIFFIGFFMLIFTFWLGIIDRLTNYYFIVEILILGSMFKITSKTERTFIIVLLLLYYILIYTYFILNNEIYFPYKTFWGLVI